MLAARVASSYRPLVVSNVVGDFYSRFNFSPFRCLIAFLCLVFCGTGFLVPFALFMALLFLGI